MEKYSLVVGRVTCNHFVSLSPPLVVLVSVSRSSRSISIASLPFTTHKNSVVSFPTSQQAVDAVARYNNTDFEGRRMVVRPQRTAAPAGAAGVFFGGLPWTYTDADLTNLVAPYNPVSTPAVAMTLTGRSRGFAIVHFASAEAAQRAINELNLATVGDRQISARPDEGRDGAPANRGDRAARPRRSRRRNEEATAEVAAPVAETAAPATEGEARRKRTRKPRQRHAAGEEGAAAIDAVVPAPAATEARAPRQRREPREPREPRERREPEAEGAPCNSLYIGGLDKRNTDEAALQTHLTTVLGGLASKVTGLELQKIEKGAR